MSAAKEFIDNYLAHEYDPAKAREYYLRTRKLKGRDKGQQDAPSGVAPAGKVAVVKGQSPPPAKTPQAQKSTGTRVAELGARLDRLKDALGVLQQQIDAAKARSGIDPKEKSAEKKPATADKGSEKKSATQKKADAKAAAERYEKNKKSETSTDAQAIQDEIEEVQKKIADAKSALMAALAKARAASSKPKAVAQGPSKPQNQKQEGDRQNGT